MMEIIDFGLSDYEEILKMQESFFDALLQSKKKGEQGKEYILIGEHKPVITMGRHANESNVLTSVEFLNEREIGLFHIGRGGDVTYHCPGQIIIYPIIDLEKHGLGVKDYVNILEETVILLLKKYGIKGERIEGATGVWIGKDTSRERKVSAIGIKCSRFCTMHGLSLNVCNDMQGFSLINPCGFQDKGVTSIKQELNHEATKDEQSLEISINKIKKEFLHIFLSLIFPLKEVLDLLK